MLYFCIHWEFDRDFELDAISAISGWTTDVTW